MATPTTLPSGVYSAYKRATHYFLDWLLRAQTHGIRNASSASPTLDVFDTVVDIIARAPATQLSPTLLHTLPRALAACQTAITLRERVMHYFASAGAADDAHAHFLTRLKTWRAILQRVDHTSASAVVPGTGQGKKSKQQRQKKPKQATKTDATGDYDLEGGDDDTDASLRFTNYYDVLRLPDDYFAEPEVDVADSSIVTLVMTPTDRNQLLDHVFEHDLQMELACLLVEMEEMVDQVYETYVDVKRETRTLVEATTVTYTALLLVQSRVAALQLRYPSIREAQDVLTLLGERATRDLPDRLAAALNRLSLEKPSTMGHLPGLFLADFVWVGSALATFTSAIPLDKKQAIVLKDGYFGETYDEETTPHYMLPDISSVSPFFMQQLPLLYNALMASRLVGDAKPIGNSNQPPPGLGDAFWTLMDEYFTTQKVGIPVTFACICWIKSVTALQGNGGLRRHVSVAIAHTWELEKRLQQSVANAHVKKAARTIHDAMEAMLTEVQTNRQELVKGSARGVLRSNPILAGSTMLREHVRFLQFGGEAVLVTSRLRAFLHLYCALVDRQLLAKIPFFEELLGIYEEVMFTPSRAAAAHGSYCRTYMLSSHLTAAAVDALFRGAPPLPKHTAIKVRECFHLRDVSSAFRVVTEHDLSMLAPRHRSLPAKDLLQHMADQCAREVRTTRVLSRDMLKLNDDLTDLFESLCDALGRRSYHDDYLSRQVPGLSRQHMVNRALEDAVMMPLLPFLDCLELDGRVDATKLLRTDAVKMAHVADSAIAQYCRRAAAIIHACFGGLQRAATIERSYFLLPVDTTMVSREFGDHDFKRDTQNPHRSQHYSEIMDLLEAATGPLTSVELTRLKQRVKADPKLLVLSSGGKPLPMILHHAAAGAVHDAALVEWLIQMGALYWQPSEHYRTGKAAAWMDPSMLPNELPVHSAAAAGYMDTVMLLLEADNMRDLNTKTFHTKDTLVHLAVKHSHRELVELLLTLGADVRDRNASGQRVSDCTSDVDWKRKLVTTIVEQVRTWGGPAQPSRETQFRQQQLQQAEQLLQAMAAQREQERGVASGTTRKANKKQQNKKKK